MSLGAGCRGGRRVSRAGGRLAGRRAGALAVHRAAWEAKRWHLRVEGARDGWPRVCRVVVGHVTMVGRGTAAAASGLAGIARLGEDTNCAGSRSVGGMEGGGEMAPFSYRELEGAESVGGVVGLKMKGRGCVPTTYEVQWCDLGFFPRRRSGSDVPRIWFFPQQCGGAARWGGHWTTSRRGPRPGRREYTVHRPPAHGTLPQRQSPARHEELSAGVDVTGTQDKGRTWNTGFGRSYYATRVGLPVEFSVGLFEFWVARPIG